MKTLKKLFCLTLSVLLAFSCFAAVPVANATDEIIPTIVVGGYSSSDLFLDYGLDTEQHVWGLNKDMVLSQLKNNLGVFDIAAANLGKKDEAVILNALAGVVNEVAGLLACNPDGTSKNNVTAGLTDPALSNTKALKAKYGDNATGYIQLPRINEDFCAQIGEENVFNCHVDFRMGAVKCAKQLDDYVQAVKAYTGASQVDLMGLSHGGMTIGVFLSLVENYPDMVSSVPADIHNALLFHPALAGADFLTTIIKREVKLTKEQIVEYAEVGALSEYELEIIMHMIDAGILDSIINRLIAKVWDNTIAYWGSVWDFTDPDIYEEMKEKLLDPTESAQLIKESDFMHYSIMPNYAQAFNSLRSKGVNINIIAGYGREAVTGGEKNSDAILSITSTTGAKAAPLGQRFADGYTAGGSICTDRSHFHVSPTMEIDASYAYLPENTFFVYRQFHGQAWFDDYTMQLIMKLMYTDEIKDVYSNPDYEQFEYSRTKKDELTIDFDGSAPTGFMAQDAKGVYVTNQSTKTIIIASMYCRGMNLKFSTLNSPKVDSGKTVYIPFTGEIANVNAARDTLVINYAQAAISFSGVREIPFTVVGGAEIEFDKSNPYSPFGLSDPFDAVIKGSKLDKISSTFGFRSILSAIYNTFLKYFSGLVAFLKSVTK